MEYTPKSEIDNRIKRFQTLMERQGIEGALIVQAADLFYFSGTAQNAHLYIPVQGKPVMMVRKSYTRARQESALSDVVLLTSLKKLPEFIRSAGYKIPHALGLEMDTLPAGQYLFYGQIFNGSSFVDVSGIIRETRQIKSAYEIDLLRNSGRKMNEVYLKIPEMIKEGMLEIELAANIEYLARNAGHMGYIRMRAFNNAPFFGHLMSGARSAVPSAFDGATGGPGLSPCHPQSGGLNAIAKGEPILIDYVGLWNGYITDQTRIYSIGDLPDNLVKAMDTALEIQDNLIKAINPGVSGSDLHRLALDMAADAGLAEYFMGYGLDQARFVGHGVGLELDELPIFAQGVDSILQEGMVFALEPKFVFPGQGTVGIENTFVLTDKGVEKITITPDEIVVVGSK